MIKWPDHYHPSRAPVHVVNELTIPAPCEVVWAWLIRAPLWPSWYPNSSDVRLVDRPQSELRLGTLFTWRTFGVKLKSTVQEFVPRERVAWSARAWRRCLSRLAALAPAVGYSCHHGRDSVWMRCADAEAIHAGPDETRAPVVAREIERERSDGYASVMSVTIIDSRR